MPISIRSKTAAVARTAPSTRSVSREQPRRPAPHRARRSHLRRVGASRSCRCRWESRSMQRARVRDRRDALGNRPRRSRRSRRHESLRSRPRLAERAGVADRSDDRRWRGRELWPRCSRRRILAIGSDGALYIADFVVAGSPDLARVRRVERAKRSIDTVAGGGRDLTPDMKISRRVGVRA